MILLWTKFMVHWKRRRRKEGGTKTGVLFQRSDQVTGEMVLVHVTHMCIPYMYLHTSTYMGGPRGIGVGEKMYIVCIIIFSDGEDFPTCQPPTFSRFAPKFRLMSIAPTRVPNRSSPSSHPYPTGQWPNLGDFARPSYLFPYLPILSLLLLVRPTVFSQRPNTFFPTPTPTPTLTHPLSRTSTTDPDYRKSLSNTPRSTLCLPHRSLSRSIS